MFVVFVYYMGGGGGGDGATNFLVDRVISPYFLEIGVLPFLAFFFFFFFSKCHIVLYLTMGIILYDA